jgi:hypothetical protein
MKSDNMISRLYNANGEFSTLKELLVIMKRMIIFLFTGMLSCGLFMQALAQDSDSTQSALIQTTAEISENASSKIMNEPAANSNISLSKIKLSGYAYYMFGQIMHGMYGDDFTASKKFSHLWQNKSLIHLNTATDATDWLTAKVGFEMYVDFPINTASKSDRNMYFRGYKSYLSYAEGIMHWNLDNSIMNSIVVESGLFPYTINPEVKTLGNYLHRSTVHPVAITNKNDYPWADLLGVCAEAGFMENKVKLEAMLSSEFVYLPFFDFTPTFTVSYAPNKVIDVAGAIAFNHAIQADGGLLTDSIGKKWQGTKIDARAIFDPKPLFGGLNFMGKEDCKIYSEIAFLGLKDSLEVDTSGIGSLGVEFPENSITHRMPIMIGFNLPMFKLLDVFSVELEWFNSPYANSWYGENESQSSAATAPLTAEQWNNYINDDNFKWSIHLDKSIGKFEIKTIIGSDHTIYKIYNTSSGNFEQTMKQKGDWQWWVELRYNL